MSEKSSHQQLLDWLIRHFDGQDHAPPPRSLSALSDEAERLVRYHLGAHQPLRRAVVAKKLKILAENLGRAAEVANELGEQGISQVLLASDANNSPEANESIRIIASLQNWALWSSRAAETAQLMSVSDRDHKGGRTPDTRLRNLVTMLIERFENLLGINVSHTCHKEFGLGISTFDLFVKETVRLYSPIGSHFEPRLIDEAINWARKARGE